MRDHLPLISAWKGSIQKLGFDLMKYRTLAQAKDSHVFAFRKVEGVGEDNGADGMNTPSVSLWMNQDYNPVYKDEQSQENSNPTSSINQDRVLPSDVIPVAIIGGGIGGVSLALALKLRGIPYRLFEKDVNINVRKQGYGLTLQQSNAALKALGIDKRELLQYGVPSSSHFSYDSSGRLIGQYGKARALKNPSIQFAKFGEEKYKSIVNNLERQSADESDSVRLHNIHIARQKLREILIDKIDPSSISWGKQLVTFEEDRSSEEGLITLSFADRSSQRAQVVVAADGIYSKLRSIKSDPSDTLRYLGVVVILGISEGYIAEDYTADRVQVQVNIFCFHPPCIFQNIFTSN